MSNILNGKYIKVKETQFEMVCDFLYSNGYEWCFDLESGRKYPNLITYDKHQLYIYSD